MDVSDSHMRASHRAAVVGLLSIGAAMGSTLSSGVAYANCSGSDGLIGRIGECMAADPTIVQGGFATSPALVAPRAVAPIMDLQPSTIRAFCAISECFLITDLPGAGIGGKP